MNNWNEDLRIMILVEFILPLENIETIQKLILKKIIYQILNLNSIF